MKKSGWISIFVVLSILSSAPFATAEWSSDPSVNLSIADRTGDQVQPKIQPTADGGCYISWFDNAGGGYDVYLQRLDAAGNELWVHNGLLQADRSFSSTEDYGLDIDTAGNALLAFRDDRFGPTVITAVKVAPDGTNLWGTNGIQLSRGEDVHTPKIVGTSDGNVVVGWTHESSVKLQKLDGDGTPLWGAGVLLSDTGDRFFGISDLHDSDMGSVIVSWVASGPMFWDPKHIWAQKLSSAGNTLWNTPGPHVIVFDGGSLQFGNFPSFVTDGSGGAVFSWYSVSPLQCYVQRVLADGSEAFAHNGVPASTNMSQVRVSPSASFRTATEEIFLFWTEENASQSQFGLYGQKFDPYGTRQWSDNGRVLIPLGAEELSFVSNLQYGEGAMVFTFATPSFGNSYVYATRVDGGGDFVWPDEVIMACSLPSEKGRLDAAWSTEGYAVLAWHDDRTGDRDVFGQNVNPDGTLGVSTGDTFDVSINCLTPYLNLPDTGYFRVILTNTSAEPIDLYGHLDGILCNGAYLADIREHSMTLDAGVTRTFLLPLSIPAHPVLTCDCDLLVKILIQDTGSLWEESDSCVVTTSCP